MAFSFRWLKSADKNVLLFPGDCANCSAEHGTCLKGFCECDDGWEGVTCEQKGWCKKPVFLSSLSTLNQGTVKKTVEKFGLKPCIFVHKKYNSWLL